MTTFVPAWKRLGLQLKNSSPVAAQSAPPPPKSSNADHVSKKRKVNDAEPAIAKSSKDEQSIDHLKKRTKITFEDQEQGSEVVSTPTASTSKSTQKPKSILKKPKKSPAKPSSNLNGSAGESLDPLYGKDDEPAPPKSKQEKKEKRQKRREQEASSSTTADADVTKPYLSYLTSYHETPEQWKFNKNHQNQLLASAFNLYRIPASYDAAMSAYVIGLKGAAARERLGLQGRSILAEPVDSANSADEKKVARRARAEKIVEALEKGEAAPSAKQEPANTADEGDANPQQAQPRKKSRGRKRRVAAVEEDSSSSESSEESSSDSSSDDD